MTQRIALGTTSDGYTYFRVSKSGYSIWDADSRHYLMHESFFSSMPVMNVAIGAVQQICVGYMTWNGIPDYSAYGVAYIYRSAFYHGLGFIPFTIVSGNTNNVSITVDANYVYIQLGGYPSTKGGNGYVVNQYTPTGGYVGLPSQLNIYVYGIAA